ncbi:MAG: cobalt-precorrin-5B (C(1))-methyltransferase [Chloroflexi bacterium]|nr:cobalt-precorrin-5B (C(1))-methyltransferase [Chloroflexota bacterium]
MPNPPYPVPPRNRKGTRTGYTTGTCASAAAKAATLALRQGRPVETVSVTLPIGIEATFTPVEWQVSNDEAYCCIVKDAGDDPDVTHGALVCARARRRVGEATIGLEGGVGVGRVTLPGLGLEVGGPAINPVPRRQILENVADALGGAAPTTALEVIIEVPEGEQLAKRTLNPRLGIVGGISILGTTGLVYPYSTAAWRASVIQAVEMAAANSVDKVVLATGGRSERFAMSLFPELPKVAFVEVSVFTGDGLKTCLRCGVKSAVFVAMIGKLVKTAQGHFTTHVAGNQVDMNFLAGVAAACGASVSVVAQMHSANTARHYMEICLANGLERVLQRLTEIALDRCAEFIEGRMDMEMALIDFEGGVLGRAARPRIADAQAEGGEPFIQRLAKSDEELRDTPEVDEFEE